MKKFLSLFLFFLFISPTLFADEITHQLGNSGYAIRWAMQKGANKKSHDHYRKAVELQRQARIKLSQRYIKEAMSLSKEAEKEAKIALEESRNLTCSSKKKEVSLGCPL